MLFNSFEFAIFLVFVFFLYWFLPFKNLRAQNALILLASYIFYGWWDWRFLSLIVISSLVDFIAAQKIYTSNSVRQRKTFLILSLAVNLGFLGFFKYFNFFISNLENALADLGLHLNTFTLNIILPVGISFYTFQTMAYTIDVYHGTQKPTNDIIAFFAFVSFFPQLVAGPIERAKHLLPQFLTPRQFNPEKATDGLRQMLWGLFKKVVIADSCAVFVNDIFANSDIYSGSTLALGVVLFAFQIYGDFSGYSDIAIGTARLFGFDLMQNFAFPYFSRDVAEFWRRWHISLTTWFRDYVYIPLGGSRGSRLKIIRNTFIIFIVSGFWHGANWTFIFWGILNALYFMPLLLMNKNRIHLDSVARGKILHSPVELMQIIFTFILICFSWIFFRSANLSQAFHYIHNLFSMSFFTAPQLNIGMLGIFLLILIVVEWLQRDKQHALQFSPVMARPLRWGFYYAIILMLILAQNEPQTFIYFQF